ncbi:MAG: outer membrane lipoprotein carrier protein LolA [Halobacteria archaeon]
MNKDTVLTIVAISLLLLVALSGCLASDGADNKPNGSTDENTFTGEMVVETVREGPVQKRWVREVLDNGTLMNRSEKPEGRFVNERRVTREIERNGTTVNQTLIVRNYMVNETKKREAIADVAFRRPDKMSLRFSHSPYGIDRVVMNGSTVYVFREDTWGKTNLSKVGLETVGIPPHLFDLDNLSKRKVGKEKLDGRPTVIYEPETNEDVMHDVDRVWVDSETGMPVKFHRKKSLGKHSITTNVTYSNLSFGVDVPESRFEVGEITNPKAGTVEEARKRSGFSFPEFGNPENFSIDEIRVDNGKEYVTFTLIQNNVTNPSSMNLQFGKDGEPDLPRRATSIRIETANGTVEGKIFEPPGPDGPEPGFRILGFRCGDSDTMIRGNATEESMRNLAKKIECS